MSKVHKSLIWFNLLSKLTFLIVIFLFILWGLKFFTSYLLIWDFIFKVNIFILIFERTQKPRDGFKLLFKWSLIRFLILIDIVLINSILDIFFLMFAFRLLDISGLFMKIFIEIFGRLSVGIFEREIILDPLIQFIITLSQRHLGIEEIFFFHQSFVVVCVIKRDIDEMKARERTVFIHYRFCFHIKLFNFAP